MNHTTPERAELEALRKIVEKQQFWEDRYSELHTAARRVYRYWGVDRELTDASIKAMDNLIQRHQREIADEDQPE